MQQHSMKPFFSVIIPTYNRSRDLKRAVDSVLSQSFCDFEILVMDDGSTDDTREVMRAIHDPRVTYDWDKNFGGPARPRNRGIALAKGEWICFLDADDSWLPEKLQVCFHHINESVDLIYHDLKIVGNVKTKYKNNVNKSRQLKKPVLIDLLENSNVISNSSVCVRKIILDRIGEIDENTDMIASEDYNAWLRIASITDKFLYIPQVLGLYSVHQGNISSRDMRLSVECARKKYLHLITESQDTKYMHKIRYLSGRQEFIRREYKNAYINLLYSLKHGGLQIKIKSLYMIAIIKSLKHSG